MTSFRLCNTVADQGGDIAKTAAIAAGWNDDVAGTNPDSAHLA